MALADDQQSDPRRVPQPARSRSGSRGRRRGGHRSRGGRPGHRDASRCRAHGHPHARRRRPLGHRADRGEPRPRLDARGRGHDVRARRVRGAGDPCGGERVPGERHRAGRADPRRACRRRVVTPCSARASPNACSNASPAACATPPTDARLADAHRPRARGAGARRTGAQQRGDRARAVPEPAHREDARLAHHGQAAGA